MLKSFYVMYRNEVVADVKIENNILIYVKKYTENPAIQPFCGKALTIDRVYKFLNNRCFSQSRPDKYAILDAMGLKKYDVIEIINKTHGHMWDDCTWIRFYDENLTWEDIKNGVSMWSDSKGTQPKYHKDGYWYKADAFEKEGVYYE